jgi:hypothetical protein
MATFKPAFDLIYLYKFLHEVPPHTHTQTKLVVYKYCDGCQLPFNFSSNTIVVVCAGALSCWKYA